jgi:fructoselysine-6-P-deglycase FrlB-like protein
LGGRLIIDPYIADILAQPAASREALRNYSPGRLHIIHERLQRGDFDRILLSGMGSSYNAAYPALIQLSSQPIPVQLINAAEILQG